MMIMIIILLIAIFIMLSVMTSVLNQSKQQSKPEISQKNVINGIDYNKYTTKNYIMTQTELIFYRELKKITAPLDLSIFPQVDLERIIQVKDNDFSYRNRIKSRTIDYTIVSNKNCRIICCIELDDYTHNSQKAKQNDNFKDNLFNAVNLPLFRVKVASNYNLQELQAKISQSIS